MLDHHLLFWLIICNGWGAKSSVVYGSSNNTQKGLGDGKAEWANDKPRKAKKVEREDVLRNCVLVCM